MELNERIKQELNPRKIDEPPTPYLSPQGTEDESDVLGEFSWQCTFSRIYLHFTLLQILLSRHSHIHQIYINSIYLIQFNNPSLSSSSYIADGSGVAPLSIDDGPAQAPAPVRVSRHHSSPWSDSSDQNGGSPSPRYPSSNGRSSSRSPRVSGDYYVDGSDEDEDDLHDGNENGEGVEGQAEKRRKFRAARKAHYEMKEAMLKAKELLKSEEEDEGVGEESIRMELQA